MKRFEQGYFRERITAGNVLDLVYNAPSAPPDNRGNIKSIIDALDNSKSQYFSYDLKDQLISASGAYGNFNWTYDALGNRIQQVKDGIATDYSYQTGTNKLNQTQTIDPPSTSSFENNVLTIYYAHGKKPQGRSLQAEFDEMLAEAYKALDDADKGKTSRSYNSVIGKFNSFLNHTQIDRKAFNQIFAGQYNLSRLLAEFLDRRKWNGPRFEDPRTWSPDQRQLARQILDLAGQIQIVEIEQEQTVVKTDAYSYDPVGSMSQKVSYLDGIQQSQETYINNDDSRLESVLGTQASFGDYAYDHLGQRVLKAEIGYTIFIYDIFGNLISEFDPNGNNIRDWVYLGNHRLALIQPSQPGGPGFPGCAGLPPPPDICGLGGLDDGVALNWAIIGIAPFLVWAGFKYRRKPKVLLLVFMAGFGIIIFMIAFEARPNSESLTPNSESVFYYHNDHLGTPKVLTDQNGVIQWEAVMEPFGEIDTFIASNANNPFRFPGQYEDDLTGLYYNHHRYYIPGLGRYNRVDPKEYNKYCSNYIYNILGFYDSYGGYNYTNNKPVVRYDETGLISLHIDTGGGGDCSSSACVYYKEICNQDQCRYHCYFAPFPCEKGFPWKRDPSDSTNMCVRCCLIQEDKICREEAKKECEKCPSTYCIITAHYKCFTICGL